MSASAHVRSSGMFWKRLYARGRPSVTWRDLSMSTTSIKVSWRSNGVVSRSEFRRRLAAAWGKRSENHRGMRTARNGIRSSNLPCSLDLTSWIEHWILVATVGTIDEQILLLPVQLLCIYTLLNVGRPTWYLGPHKKNQIRCHCKSAVDYRVTVMKYLDFINLLKPDSSNYYTLPYRSNLPFLISDIRALWRSALSARAPECQKLKTVG